MAIPSFEEILNQMLTDFRNQAPDEDVSEGSLHFLRYACVSSAIWGIYKSSQRTKNQIWPDTADREELEHHAFLDGIVRQEAETDASLLSRILETRRAPGRGGNRYDYPIWMKEKSVVAGTIHNPTSAMLSSSGLGSFSAAQCVDDNDGTKAFDTNSATPGAFLKIDCGTGNHRQFVKCEFYMSAAGGTAEWTVEHSEDDMTYTPVETGGTAQYAEWNPIQWTADGSHRYWRIRLENTPGPGPDVMGIRLAAGAEQVEMAHCLPLAQGVGTVDNYITSNLELSNPSDTLLSIVREHVLDQAPADLPAGNIRILRPEFSMQTIDVTAYGSCDRESAKSDIIAWTNALGLGETLYRTKIAAICIDNGADGADVNTPAADTTPNQSTVVRTTSDLVTVS